MIELTRDGHTRIRIGEGGTYLEYRLAPRQTRGVLNHRGRSEQRSLEANCWLKTGPAGMPMVVFEPTLLAKLGWQMLTASHRLLRLQGGATLEEITADPQLTIYDALAVQR